MTLLHWCGVGSLSFEGDSDSGPYLFRLDLSIILLHLFDFCAVYFKTKTLFSQYCAPFITQMYTFSQVILRYTIVMSQNKYWGRSESESDFWCGVGIPQKNKDWASLPLSTDVVQL